MRILLIEDNGAASDILAQALDNVKEEQVFVQTVLSIDRAQEVLTLRKFDIICYNPLAAGDLTPTEGFNRLRKLAPETPIVALSGNYDHDLNVALSEIGTRYIPKTGLVPGALYSLLKLNEEAFKSKRELNLHIAGA